MGHLIERVSIILEVELDELVSVIAIDLVDILVISAFIPMALLNLVLLQLIQKPLVVKVEDVSRLHSHSDGRVVGSRIEGHLLNSTCLRIVLVSRKQRAIV